MHLQEKAIKRKDSEAFDVSDLNFHNSIVEGSQNDILSTVYNAFSNLMLKSRRRTNKIAGVAQESLEDHQKLSLAIKSDNRNLAHQAMFTNIDKIEGNMNRILCRQKKFPSKSKAG